jgi:hypothetical protein
MALNPKKVSGNELQPRGILGLDPSKQDAEGYVEVAYSADFSAPVAYLFDFSLLQQSNTFSIPETIFIDNSENPNSIRITISQTNQSFPIPAYTAGYFPINAQANSTILMETTGGVATGNLSSVQFFNYAISPNTWTGFGPLVPGFKTLIIGPDQVNTVNFGANSWPVQGSAAAGAAPGAQRPVYTAGWDGALVRPLKTDATGRLEVIGSAAGGNVYGPDAIGTAPTQPPVYVAVRGPTGLIAFMQVDATNNLLVSDVNETPVTAVARSSIPGAAVSTVIKTAGACKSIELFNDSTAIAYVGFGATAVSLADYTLKMYPDAYYEVPDKLRNMEIRAIWASATGAMKLTVGT